MKKFLLINVVLTACAVCVLRSEEPVDVSTLLMRAINDDWEANYQLGLCRINGNMHSLVALLGIRRILTFLDQPML